MKKMKLKLLQLKEKKEKLDIKISRYEEEGLTYTDEIDEALSINNKIFTILDLIDIYEENKNFEKSIELLSLQYLSFIEENPKHSDLYVERIQFLKTQLEEAGN